MNKRIQELLSQAGLYVDLNGQPWPRNMSAEESEAAYKKFAELIITECATIALREEHDPYECILSHFGVDTIDGQLRKRSTYFGNNP